MTNPSRKQTYSTRCAKHHVTAVDAHTHSYLNLLHLHLHYSQNNRGVETVINQYSRYSCVPLLNYPHPSLSISPFRLAAPPCTTAPPHTASSPGFQDYCFLIILFPLPPPLLPTNAGPPLVGRLCVNTSTDKEGE